MAPHSAQSQPLKGYRILVGRARHQASALSDELRRLGAEVLEIPFIDIRKPQSFEPLDTALKNIAAYHWLILTSVNGVSALWDRIGELSLSDHGLRNLQIAAIGPATKKAIEKRGLTVRVVPKEYVAESVVDSLRNRVEGKRVLLVRAKVARDVIPRELRQLGAQVDVAEAYETVIPESSRMLLRSAMQNSTRRPDVITFTSSSTVRNFIRLLGKMEVPRETKFASIGPVTSSTLRACDLPVDIEAREYTIPGLTQALIDYADGDRHSPM
jgi:uroporphyrinogen-III synthase